MRFKRMETKGIEKSAFSISKPPISENGGAKSGAPIDDFFKKYPDFANIIAASNLPIEFKQTLVSTLKRKVIVLTISPKNKVISLTLILTLLAGTAGAYQSGYQSTYSNSA